MEGKYFSHRFSELGLNRPSAVLLVDDIVTRGATMNDARQAALERSNCSESPVSHGRYTVLGPQRCNSEKKALGK